MAARMSTIFLIERCLRPNCVRRRTGALATFGPGGRRRAPGIVGPRMFRVSSAQLLPDLGIGSVPEAAKIACQLDGPAVGSQECEDDRLAARTDTRRLGQSKKLLQFHRRGHAAIL